MKKSGQTNATRQLCYTALAAAILAVCAWVAIPIGNIPVTLQTLGVCLIAGLLGVKYSFFAVVAYLILGFVGVPVFAGFTGGVGKLFQPTGGFLLGFLLAAPLISWLCKGKGFWERSAVMLYGVALCYLLGTIWFSWVSGVGLWQSAMLCVVPYFWTDAIKILAASYLTGKLKKIL